MCLKRCRQQGCLFVPKNIVEMVELVGQTVEMYFGEKVQKAGQGRVGVYEPSVL